MNAYLTRDKYNRIFLWQCLPMLDANGTWNAGYAINAKGIEITNIEYFSQFVTCENSPLKITSISLKQSKRL